jgi:uncharacterized protein (TIGR02147 family)
MVKASLYSAKDYRDFLRAKVEDDSERGALTRLAAAAKCQKSHVTRVLRGDLHLTLEQAFRLARYWRLGDDEENYFLKLVDRDRAGDAAYRAKLQGELARMKRAQEDLSVRLQQATMGSSEKEMLYYSSWFWSAIHIIVSIPRYQAPAQIAARLGLPEPLVLHALKTLEGFGLVEKSKDRWKIATGSIHLPKNSPLNSIQHGNWRSRAVLNSQAPGEDGVHYTVVQSISEADFEKIKHLLLEAIDRYAKIAGPSREEELVCFACDFFRV